MLLGIKLIFSPINPYQCSHPSHHFMDSNLKEKIAQLETVMELHFSEVECETQWALNYFPQLDILLLRHKHGENDQ